MESEAVVVCAGGFQPAMTGGYWFLPGHIVANMRKADINWRSTRTRVPVCELPATSSADTAFALGPHPTWRLPRCIQFLALVFPKRTFYSRDRHLPPVLEPARRFGVLALMLILAGSALGQTTDPVQFIFAFNRDVSASSA